MPKYNSVLLHKGKPFIYYLTLLFGSLLLSFVIFLSLSYGAANTSLVTLWNALFRYDESIISQQIIRQIRFPRVIGSVLIGGALAVAGAIMQGVTRNPLADSGLLGLNAGASLALAFCFGFMPNLPYVALLLFCFAGAGLGAFLVYGIGSLSHSGLTPLRLILAGTAVSALFASLSEAISLYKNSGQDLTFWYIGGISTITWTSLRIITPFILAAFICALFLRKSVTLISLGEETAISLGQNITLIRLFSMVVVAVLAGSSVAIVGPIGFVGLLVPHITRTIVGNDYQKIIPCSALLGSLLVVLADLAGRMINPPFETPIGVLISLIGIPFFLHLVRKRGVY